MDLNSESHGQKWMNFTCSFLELQSEHCRTTLFFGSSTIYPPDLPASVQSTVTSLVARRGTLLMELGFLRAFLGIFPRKVKKNIFWMEGSMWGAYKVRCLLPSYMRWFSIWWQGACEVKMPMWGENVHMRWECPCKVTFDMVEGIPHCTLGSNPAYIP